MTQEKDHQIIAYLASALADMKDAYERKIRSACGPEELKTEPWRCQEYCAAEMLLERCKTRVTAARDFMAAQSGKAAKATAEAA